VDVGPDAPFCRGRRPNGVVGVRHFRLATVAGGWLIICLALWYRFGLGAGLGVGIWALLAVEAGRYYEPPAEGRR
jgi:hypothetical protein